MNGEYDWSCLGAAGIHQSVLTNFWDDFLVLKSTITKGLRDLPNVDSAKRGKTPNFVPRNRHKKAREL